jgi:hypothetical protein
MTSLERSFSINSSKNSGIFEDIGQTAGERRGAAAAAAAGGWLAARQVMCDSYRSNHCDIKSSETAEVKVIEKNQNVPLDGGKMIGIIVGFRTE